MVDDEKLMEWIQKKLDNGVSEKRIRKSLRNTGHDPSLIEKAKDPFNKGDEQQQSDTRSSESPDSPPEDFQDQNSASDRNKQQKRDSQPDNSETSQSKDTNRNTDSRNQNPQENNREQNTGRENVSGDSEARISPQNNQGNNRDRENDTKRQDNESQQGNSQNLNRGQNQNRDQSQNRNQQNNQQRQQQPSQNNQRQNQNSVESKKQEMYEKRRQQTQDNQNRNVNQQKAQKNQDKGRSLPSVSTPDVGRSSIPSVDLSVFPLKTIAILLIVFLIIGGGVFAFQSSMISGISVPDVQSDSDNTDNNEQNDQSTDTISTTGCPDSTGVRVSDATAVDGGFEANLEIYGPAISGTAKLLSDGNEVDSQTFEIRDSKTVTLSGEGDQIIFQPTDCSNIRDTFSLN